MHLMDLKEKGQDDYVPIQVVQEFSRKFIRGFGKMMEDIGFAENWVKCELNKRIIQNQKQAQLF